MLCLYVYMYAATVCVVTVCGCLCCVCMYYFVQVMGITHINCVVVHVLICILRAWHHGALQCGAPVVAWQFKKSHDDLTYDLWSEYTYTCITTPLSPLHMHVVCIKYIYFVLSVLVAYMFVFAHIFWHGHIYCTEHNIICSSCTYIVTQTRMLSIPACAESNGDMFCTTKRFCVYPGRIGTYAPGGFICTQHKD